MDYDACNSDCDCLGINTFENYYKYFVTTKYGRVYNLFYERCTDCHNSLGVHQCLPVAPYLYVNVGTHKVEGELYGGFYLGLIRTIMREVFITLLIS